MNLLLYWGVLETVAKIVRVIFLGHIISKFCFIAKGGKSVGLIINRICSRFMHDVSGQTV